ncbi:phospho-sugar mutase [Antribacter gilvus]|uniref:phospho-sugar mutase n=1 Tax=Antribacter gilvus TaxID=2304675 RepID=UPI000F772B3A|nr:phospho-sugar mutase [Antribacter gilvus]
MTSIIPLDTDEPGSDPGSDVQDLLDRAEAWARSDVDEVDRAELRALLDRVTHTPPSVRNADAAANPALRDPRPARVRAVALAELRDRFAGSLQFGTAGLRGAMAAGPNRMNRAVVIRAAAGLGTYLSSALDGEDDAPRVVVGYDARHRSAQFAEDTAAVLTAAGAEVLLLPRPLPTPVLAFAVRHLDADAGVMVTASHNPAGDNGYKVYLGGRVVTDAGQGAQIVPPYDAGIAAAIAAAPPAADVARAGSGWTVLGRDVAEAYLASVAALTARSDGIPTGSARSLRIVTTSLHGVGGVLLGRVLSDAGFRHVVPVEEQLDPDPRFPTVVFPNPEEPGAIDMALAVAQDCAADVVLANDPDADRCAVAVLDPAVGAYRGPETARSQGWRMLHGDEVGALLGWETATFEAARVRAGGPGTEAGVLASSVVSSRLLGTIAAHHGLRHATTLTGFKWISRTPGLAFGYEEALGYCLDPAHVRDKDGLSAAVTVALLADRLKSQGRTLLDALDDIARACGLYVTDQLSARFDSLDDITGTMTRLRATPPRTLAGVGVARVVDLASGSDGLPPTDGVMLLGADDTRVIVRPSGTEPKVKCYLEVVTAVPSDATTDALAEARADAGRKLARIKDDLRAALGL